MASIIRTALCAALLVASVLPALAKLPPPSDEAKAKAAEAAAEAAWSNQVAAFHLCTATNRVVENYHAAMKQAGKDTPAQVEPVSNCTNPGPYTPAPLESASAHSPPATAVAPPSTKATEAELKGGVKK